MTDPENIVETFIEVRLQTPEDFLKVRETLTRIGVASRKENKLYQSAHILHKKGRFYIVHFKSMFALDGKESTMSDDDIARTNTIANLLAQWGLVVLIDLKKSADPVASLAQIKIIPFKDKDKWTLVPKYQIGRKAKEQ